MSHAYILWIATFAYAMHAFEEYCFDWRGWATAVLQLPVSWEHFYLVNAAVVVLGATCAMVGWQLPLYALAFPALMFINGLLFHVLPFLWTAGRFSPGLFTAVGLFFPLGGWAYYGAWQDGVLTVAVGLESFLLAALLMLSPIVMLKLRSRPYFRQN
ncbi:MAG TPA: HXXEE domain-containing protein [Pirellulales bacterium]|jgi:hypothetical protein|nr:HXXEE domain-containing protein [Pirellulales bacterium]